MISKFSTPSMESATSGGGANTNKILMFAALIIGGIVIYRFIIKPEMDKQTIIYENADDGSFE